MSKLLIDGRHALYSPALASRIGRSAATILQQVYYWMSIEGGKTTDGVKWFWKTYEHWATELSLSVSTVRRAIAKLKTLGFIAIDKLSAKTHYQANWYTLNNQAIELFLNEHIDMFTMKASICSNGADDIKDPSPKEVSPQQHAVAEKTWVVNEDVVLAPEPELPHTTRFVDDQQPENKTNDPDHHEDELSLRVREFAIDGNRPPKDARRAVDCDSLTAPGDEENSNLNKTEIAQVCTELRRLRINPEPCLGVIKKHWNNVSGAIARVKDAIAEGWCDNPTGLFINSCRTGAKGKNTVTADVSAWFEWARRQRIVLAMSGNVVYTPSGEAVGLQEMMQRYPNE